MTSTGQPSSESGSRETAAKRAVLADLDRQFARLHRNACDLVMSGAGELSLASMQERQNLLPATPVRYNVLRGAAVVEQTFGGITANLWDDPFEWTLPETLNTRERIIEYLNEVEAMRRRAFVSLASDSELSREIVVPSGERQTLISLLQETIRRAVSYQDRAAKNRDLLAASDS